MGRDALVLAAKLLAITRKPRLPASVAIKMRLTIARQLAIIG